MLDVLDELVGWWSADQPVGLATVVAASGSTPRPVGAAMAVGPDGSAVGSISGGCVEAAVYDLATEVRATGVPVVRRFGISDGDAFAVGLICGGTLDVFVERVDRTRFPQLGQLAAAIRAGAPVALVTWLVEGTSTGGNRHLVVHAERVDGTLGDAERVDGALGDAELDAVVAADARGLLNAGRTAVVKCGDRGRCQGAESSFLVTVFATRPRMIIFGAIDFTAPLVKIGTMLGYRVTVCDARPVFATARRFPDADEMVVDWPHRYLAAQVEAGAVDQRTVICVLTHDPKFDGPLLEVALRIPLGYVGAMGSRRTHQDRLRRLREAGLPEEELSRLHAPIGLDLGGSTPEETAVSIVAEIIAERRGGSCARLATVEGRIHRPAGPS